MKKISREEHFEAVEKWKEIVRRTKAGERFHSDRGFQYFLVWERCTYCDHYNCCQCPLSAVRGDDQAMCANDLSDMSIVGTFVILMRQHETNEALPYAEKV
ncbi:MAG TPA: hypothetical protein ENJ27_01970, partial [Candidatus Moranbacteria bacterium]|nr:hypothetical protein [Candidatus Moranbacteria bacterium]